MVSLSVRKYCDGFASGGERAAADAAESEQMMRGFMATMRSTLHRMRSAPVTKHLLLVRQRRAEGAAGHQRGLGLSCG